MKVKEDSRSFERRARLDSEMRLQPKDGDLCALTTKQWQEIFTMASAFSGIMTTAGVVTQVNRAALTVAGLQPRDWPVA